MTTFRRRSFSWAVWSSRTKDYKKAAEWLARCSQSDFHYMEASFLLAICRIYGGDYDSAIQLLRMVLAEFPLNEVYNNLGVALTRKSDSAAGAMFLKAIEGDPADPDYWFNAGYALWKFGQYDAAADRFRAVLDRSAGDSEATTMLGRCLKGEGPRGNETQELGGSGSRPAFEDSAFRQLQAELRATPR